MKRLLRVLKWLAAVVMGLVLLVACAVFVLLGTEWGARRALSVGAGLAGYELEWQQASGTLWQGLSFMGLSVKGPALSLELQDGGFRWLPWRLREGALQVERLWLHGVHMELAPATDAAEPSEPLQAADLEQMLASLPLALFVDELSVQALTLQQGEMNFALERLRLALRWQETGAQLELAELALYGAEASGSLRLQPNLDLGAELDWLYRMEPALRGSLELGGNLRELQLQHTLQAPVAAQSRGTVVPGIFADAPLALALQHELARLDLAAFGVEDVVLQNLLLQTQGPLEALAVSATLGVLALDFAPADVALALVYGGTAVELENLALASDEVRLALQGAYDIAGSSGQLDWTLEELTPGAWLQGVDLAGLAGGGAVAFSHDAAGLDANLQLGPLSGSLNGYPLDIAGSVVLADSQPDAIDLQINNGVNTLALQGTVLPELALDWVLDLRAPENFWQGLGGSLQGSGRVEGQLPVPLLRGELQGTALSLVQGGARYRLEALQLAAEVVGNDANTVTLDLTGLQAEQEGSAGQTWLESATLELRGNPASHSLQVSARGFDSELRLALEGEQAGTDWQGTLQLADVDSPWGHLQLEEAVPLQYGASGFSVPQHCWTLAPLSLCAQAASVASGAVDADLTLQGVPLSWFNSGAAELERPPALQTLLQQYGLLLPASMRLAGVAALEASVTGLVDGSWQELAARLQVDAASLDVELASDAALEEDDPDAAPERLQLALREPLLQLSSDGSRWQAQLQVAVEQVADPGTGVGNPPFPRSSLVGELAMESDERLDGNLRLDFPSLDWLAALLPVVEEPGGRASGNIRIRGTRSAPQFDARLNLREGRFNVPQLGLAIAALEADIAATPEQAELRVDVRDGQGNLHLQASMSEPLAATRALQATLQGERFTVMNNAAAQVEISPDLELSWSAAGLQAGGNLRVPLATIALDEWVANVGSGGVSPSRDAVVVVEDAEARVADSGTALPLQAQLQLTLGDEVHIQGLGLDARLGGELQLQQERERPLLVYGELSIPEGSYEIYNQTLQTRDGRLMFFGNPLDPVLDLRAFRETPNAEVGMELGGNVSALQSSLYSTPQLPESEILSLLITGKSFRDTNEGDSDALVSAVANFGIERTTGLTSAIGDTLGLDDVSISGGSSYLDSSLGMGKYLTPELLMRYEIGLFGRQAVFSLTYSLTERLKLEVRSGLSQSVDISYAVEKD